MNWLDISTYLVLNGGPVIAAMAVCSVASFVAIIATSAEGGDVKMAMKIVFPSSLIAILACSTSLLPSHNKILEVKIERIKNEAVNKDNIDKGIETLERIGKKLECKYLGGSECKEGE